MRVRTLAGVLAATGLVWIGGCGSVPPQDETAPPATGEVGSGEVGKRDMPPPVVVVADDPSAPADLTIDGARAPVDPVATDVAGVLVPPQDVTRLGWWADSALPGGGAGSIVVTGHVDDAAQGRGFAARFTDLAAGDPVALLLADGSVRDYRVDRVLSVGKDDALPLDELNRLDGPETLVLVTCGGEFVGPPLGYADNVFVFATPAGRT